MNFSSYKPFCGFINRRKFFTVYKHSVEQANTIAVLLT